MADGGISPRPSRREITCAPKRRNGYAALPMAPPDPALVLEEEEESDDYLALRLVDDDASSLCSSIPLLFGFVESGYFQALSAFVILGNVIMIFVEAGDPEMKKELSELELMALLFYIFELLCRICYYRKNFLCGPFRKVSWNLLDMTVVLAGGFDQWVIPRLDIERRSALRTVVQCLRMLRLLRMLKMIRIILESDLSWTEGAEFQSFIGIVIGFNALLMGFETDIQWDGWFFIEQALLMVYVFELMVRLKRFGRKFLSWRNPDIMWNALDFMIVVSSVLDSWLIPLVNLVLDALYSADDGIGPDRNKGINLSQVMMLMRMLRLMRILRLVKLVKTFKPLYILVTGVAAAVQGVVWVLVLTIVVLYAVGIMATRIIGHGLLFEEESSKHDPRFQKVFGSVANSMFTLFRVMSGSESNEEAEAIDDLMMAVPSVKFAFVFFMVSSSWTLLSILTAVVSDHMIATTGTQEEEIRIATAEEDRQAHLKDLRELFGKLDTRGTGHLDFKSIEAFLSVKENAWQTSKRCRVPARHVLEVLKTLSLDGEPVHIDLFLDCMLEVGKPVTEQSFMKLSAVVNEGQAKFTGDILSAINNLSVEQEHMRRDQECFQKDVEDRLAAVEQQAEEGLNKLEEMIDDLREELIRSGALIPKII